MIVSLYFAANRLKFNGVGVFSTVAAQYASNEHHSVFTAGERGNKANQRSVPVSMAKKQGKGKKARKQLTRMSSSREGMQVASELTAELPVAFFEKLTEEQKVALCGEGSWPTVALPGN